MLGTLSCAVSSEKMRPPMSANKPAIQKAITHQFIKNIPTPAPNTIKTAACQDKVLLCRITGCHIKKQP